MKAFSGFLLFYLLIMILPQVALAADHNWKMATAWPGGPMQEYGAKAFADKVEFLTEGRVKIKVFHSGVLGKALQVSDTVKNGVAEVGHHWVGYDWGKDKTAVLFGNYAGGPDTERMFHWIYKGGGLELWQKWREEKFGLIALPCLAYGPEVFLHSHKPVRELSDLKGLKLRTTGAWLEIAKGLGASPITSSGAEVFPMLERKVIDATEWTTLSSNISPGFYRVAKYIIYPGVHQPNAIFECLINKKAWDKLSQRDQKLVAQAAKLVTFEGWMQISHEDAEAYEFYKKQGNEYVELSREAQVKVKELGLEWAENVAAKDPYFKKIFDAQRDYEKLWEGAYKYRDYAVEVKD